LRQFELDDESTDTSQSVGYWRTLLAPEQSAVPALKRRPSSSASSTGPSRPKKVCIRGDQALPVQGSYSGILDAAGGDTPCKPAAEADQKHPALPGVDPEQLLNNRPVSEDPIERLGLDIEGAKLGFSTALAMMQAMRERENEAVRWRSSNARVKDAQFECHRGHWFVLEDLAGDELSDDPETLGMFLRQFELDDDSTDASQSVGYWRTLLAPEQRGLPSQAS